MLPIFNHNFRRLVPQIFGWGIGLAFYCAVVLCFFHIVSDNANEIQKLIESLPKALTSLVGDLDKFNTPEGYMSIRIFTIFPILLGIFAIICGSGLLLRDEEQGFLDLMMGYPISRRQIFFARLSSLIVAIMGILLIVWLGIAIGIWVSDLQVSVWKIFFPLTSLFAILCCFTALSLLLSMLLPSRIAATMTSGLIMLIAQMIANLAKLSSTLQPVAVFSPFEYYQGIKALERFDLGHFILLIAIAIVFTIMAFLQFKKRDIRVAGEGDMNWTKFTLATVTTLFIFVYTLISLTRDVSQITPRNCFKTTTVSIEEKNWKSLTKCISEQTKKEWCAAALLRGSFVALDVGDKGAIRMWQNSDQRLEIGNVEQNGTQQQVMQSLIQMQIAVANVDLKVLRRNLEIILRYPNKLFLTTDEVEKLASAVKSKDAFIQAVLRATSNLRQFENYSAIENIKLKETTATAIAITNYGQKVPISFTKNKTKWHIHLPALDFEASIPADKKSSEDNLGDYMLYENIVYDTKHQLLLDAYIPQNSQNNPGILLVHGGGWRTGDKEQLAKYAHFLASNNFACFAISYRLAPQNMFPAQINDCRTALTWLKKNATSYKVDINNVGAVGYSAGGHLVSLLATTNEKSDLKLRVVVAGGAPTDFSTLSDEVTTFRYLFGDIPSKAKNLYNLASPVVQASKQTCPIGFFHGQEDMLVSLDGPLTPVKLHKKLQKLQVATELETIATTGHFEAIYHQKSLDFTLRFLQKHLGNR
ncbi:alpha/beta hydrolase fold domain-containing protein [Candidatus Uabimicrobium amorphum]|uniref:Lipase n=1 Tax=Uabimicrobium amorphum TaxID=2596890 RepID=A0A5S9IVZ3_UABAM|nr:alpha/beta hydrolase fold domain-containing protein [Candidatus Uabimicrobium amorphum]BBM88100.1 lipase [Candidatus Uabimicrobium amorphum]